MKTKRFWVMITLVALCFSMQLQGQTNELQRSTPEAEGVPSEAVIAFFDSLMALPRTDIHSVVVMRHGKVIAEMYPTPFAPEYRHTMYSCSKTFVSAAVGLAIAENRLQLSDRVATFFPEYLPAEISDNLAAMTVRHLLTMNSGVTPDWNMRSQTPDWIRTFLAKEVKTPGKQFEYDSMATYMLSAIVQRVTGMTTLDYLKKHIFNPMHITEVAWELSPEGINTGGWGLHIQPESLAKFGQLLLNRGKWEGKQLLPAEWVDEMMKKQVESGGDGYGYQMWMSPYPGAARADGALGQFIQIVPDKELVVVITECSHNAGLNYIWKLLVPQLADQPLQAGKAYQQLQKKQYALPLVKGKQSSSMTKRLTDKTIALEENKYGWQSLRFRFNPKEVVMTVTEKGGMSYDLSFGYKEWLTVATEACPPYSINPIDKFKGIERPFYVSGSYGWASKQTLELKAHYVNWVSALGITLQFEDENVSITIRENFSGGEQQIKGNMK